MKSLASLVFALSLAALVAPAGAPGGETAEAPPGLIDLGQCSLAVKGLNRVESIKCEGGETIKASKRGAMLLELEIQGTATAEGQFGLYPSMFSLTCTYRRAHRILPSMAIGIKPKLPTGEIQEYWLSKPDATMLTGCEMGDKIRFYVLFEVPDEVREFTLQIPKALQSVSTDSP